MQVNMGEGKSSVITPIVAATLADGHQLVRVTVPKALKVQMLELLIDRLGGLTNRPTYKVSPSFSRYDLLHRGKIEAAYAEMSQCVEQFGILLVQPEDVLSLKLSSLERQLPKHKSAARLSSKLQRLINGYDMAALSLRFVSTTIAILKLVFNSLLDNSWATAILLMYFEDFPGH